MIGAGPRARRVTAAESELSAGQMLQLPTLSKFLEIMEKVLLEQG